MGAGDLVSSVMRRGAFLALCLFLSAAASAQASAATYYVATTGNDANPGTSAQPWRNPQKCVASGSPLKAGDVCEIGDGTYTSSSVAGRVMSITSASPQGTSGNPITIRAANPYGATLEAPNAWPGLDCDIKACPFSGIYISSARNYVIEGFQFTRPGAFFADLAAIAGINMFGAFDIVVRNNHFHDIGRNVCHDGIKGQGGVFAGQSVGLLFENNIFNRIGRLRNGEAGCSTARFQHDHGIYLDESADTTILGNIFYDVNRGMPINIKAYNGITSNLKIFNNTISGASPTGEPHGQIAITNKASNVQVKNNIFHDPPTGYVFWWYITSEVSNLVIENNLSNSTNATLISPYLQPSSGITYLNNTLNTDPGFVNAAAGDFRLQAGSPAIDAGLALPEVTGDFSGFARPFGSGYDIGAYEFGSTAPAPPTPSPLVGGAGAGGGGGAPAAGPTPSDSIINGVIAGAIAGFLATGAITPALLSSAMSGAVGGFLVGGVAGSLGGGGGGGGGTDKSCFSGEPCNVAGAGAGMSLFSVWFDVGPALNTAFTALTTAYHGLLQAFLGTTIVAFETSYQTFSSWLDVHWFLELRPAMQDMTDQLSTLDVDQTRTLSSLTDGSEQAGTQQIHQNEELDDQRQYRSNQFSCVASTNLGGQQRAHVIHKTLASAWTNEKLPRESNAQGTPAADGPAADQNVRWKTHLLRYCNPQDNASAAGCLTAGTFADADIDVSGAVFAKDTIDVRDTDTRQNVDDMVSNIVAPFTSQPIAPAALNSTAGREAFLAQRALTAKRQAAREAVNYVIARRAPGSQMATNLMPMRQASGADPSQLSNNPSYEEVMNAMVSERFRSGKYQVDLADEPEHVMRELVTLQALQVMQLSDQLDLADRLALLIGAETGNRINKQRLNSANGMMPLQ